MTCKRKVRLANGREVSALDIQNEYLGRAQRYAETKGFSDLEMLALEMWEHVLTQLEADPMKLDRHCDWVIKYKLIEAYRARHDSAAHRRAAAAAGPRLPGRCRGVPPRVRAGQGRPAGAGHSVAARAGGGRVARGRRLPGPARGLLPPGSRPGTRRAGGASPR